MRAVNVHEAKSTLSALLAEVEERGEVVLICRNGKPIAELRRVVRPSSRLTPAGDTSAVEFFDDPLSPVPAADWGDLG